MTHFTRPAVKTPDLPPGHQLIQTWGVILGGNDERLSRMTTSLSLYTYHHQAYLGIVDPLHGFIGPERSEQILDQLSFFTQGNLKHWALGLTIHDTSVIDHAMTAYWNWKDNKKEQTPDSAIAALEQVSA